MATAPATTHGEDCPCTRCKGFAPGHELSTKHGAYSSPVKLSARTNEIAQELWTILPSKSPVFAHAVTVAALAAARIELAAAALEDASPADAPRLDHSLRLWLRTYLTALDSLGLTPRSAADLRLNVAIGDSAEARVNDHFARRRAERQPVDLVAGENEEEPVP